MHENRPQKSSAREDIQFDLLTAPAVLQAAIKDGSLKHEEAVAILGMDDQSKVAVIRDIQKKEIRSVLANAKSILDTAQNTLYENQEFAVVPVITAGQRIDIQNLSWRNRLELLKQCQAGSATAALSPQRILSIYRMSGSSGEDSVKAAVAAGFPEVQTRNALIELEKILAKAIPAEQSKKP